MTPSQVRGHARRDAITFFVIAGSVVFQLEGTDSESEVYYGLEGSEGILSVDPRSGVVTLQKSLNHLVSRLFLHHDTGIFQGRSCARANDEILITEIQ